MLKLKLKVIDGPMEGSVFWLDWLGTRPESFGILKTMYSVLGLEPAEGLASHLEGFKDALDWTLTVKKHNKVSGEKTYENVYIKKVLSRTEANTTGYATKLEGETPKATAANHPKRKTWAESKPDAENVPF